MNVRLLDVAGLDKWQRPWRAEAKTIRALANTIRLLIFLSLIVRSYDSCSNRPAPLQSRIGERAPSCSNQSSWARLDRMQVQWLWLWLPWVPSWILNLKQMVPTRVTANITYIHLYVTHGCSLWHARVESNSVSVEPIGGSIWIQNPSVTPSSGGQYLVIMIEWHRWRLHSQVMSVILN